MVPKFRHVMQKQEGHVCVIRERNTKQHCSAKGHQFITRQGIRQHSNVLLLTFGSAFLQKVTLQGHNYLIGTPLLHDAPPQQNCPLRSELSKVPVPSSNCVLACIPKDQTSPVHSILNQATAASMRPLLTYRTLCNLSCCQYNKIKTLHKNKRLWARKTLKFAKKKKRVNIYI